jgi:hypothetical protein
VLWLVRREAEEDLGGDVVDQRRWRRHGALEVWVGDWGRVESIEHSAIGNLGIKPKSFFLSRPASLITSIQRIDTSCFVSLVDHVADYLRLGQIQIVQINLHVQSYK